VYWALILVDSVDDSFKELVGIFDHSELAHIAKKDLEENDTHRSGEYLVKGGHILNCYTRENWVDLRENRHERIREAMRARGVS
jgi:hypothetical protein